jgi:hypothetical protein
MVAKKKVRCIEVDIWESRWFQTLSKDAKYLYLYLLSNPRANICGVYQIMTETIEFQTGLIDVEKILAELTIKREVLVIDDWLIILRYPSFQSWRTAWAIGSRMVAEIEDLPKEIRDVLIQYDYQYPPIKSLDSFQAEKVRNKKPAQKEKVIPQTDQQLEGPKTIERPKQKYEYQRFNEDVPFG